MFSFFYFAFFLFFLHFISFHFPLFIVLFFSSLVSLPPTPFLLPVCILCFFFPAFLSFFFSIHLGFLPFFSSFYPSVYSSLMFCLFSLSVFFFSPHPLSGSSHTVWTGSAVVALHRGRPPEPPVNFPKPPNIGKPRPHTHTWSVICG